MGQPRSVWSQIEVCNTNQTNKKWLTRQPGPREFFIPCGAIDQDRYRALAAVQPRSKSFTVNPKQDPSASAPWSQSQTGLDESGGG